MNPCLTLVRFSSPLPVIRLFPIGSAGALLGHCYLAQFLIPIAIIIAFGLGICTVALFFLAPAVLAFLGADRSIGTKVPEVPDAGL